MGGAFLFVQRARQGKGSMPFGLPNMTDAQLLVGAVGQRMTGRRSDSLIKA